MLADMKKILFLMLPVLLCHGAQLYVDVNAPANGNGSAAKPFNKIQKAADSVNPGDTVIIKPGVYFETVHLKRFGTKDAPITFRADKIQKNRVIVTGADKAIRTKAVKWQLHDEKTLTSCASTAHPYPPRVLYSGVDLYSYKSLKLLMTFEAKPGVPGPRHGYFYDRKTQKLYVRLRADGKYGPSDPNQHVMAVAPTKGQHNDGEKADSVYYNFGLKGTPGKSLNVIIDGITFETPSRTAVYVCGNDVTVRNCLFAGCMAGGVCGRFLGASDEKERNLIASNNVTVENCEWHIFPIYDDVKELIDLVRSKKVIIKNPDDRKFHYWVHKHPNQGAKVYYETGIIHDMGKDWVLRNCHIHDAFDGLARMGSAENLIIEGCVFERCIDNAIQTEPHGKNLHIRRNRFIDTFQSVSYQPIDGTPWPSAIYVYQNLFYLTEKNIFDFGYTSAFKIGIPAGQASRPSVKKQPAMRNFNWNDIAIPGGLNIFNNTIIAPGFRLAGDLGAPAQKITNVNFYNNLAVVGTLSNSMRKPGNGGVKSYTYVNNKFALIGKWHPVFPAVKGQVTKNPSEVLAGWKNNSFIPEKFTDSTKVSGMPEHFKYVGAFQSADEKIAVNAGVKEELPAAPLK